MTTPVERPARKRRPRAVRPITVPATQSGLNPPIVTAPGRLCGWSLQAVSGFATAVTASLQGVAAAAGTLTLTGFQGVGFVEVVPEAAWPAGANVVTIGNVAGGPIIVGIEGGTANPVTVTFNPVVGAAGTPTVAVPAIVGGPAYTITASGEGSQTGIIGPIASATFTDGGQPLAQVAAQAGLRDTVFLDREGIYVGTSLAINVQTGQLQGVVFWLDDWHGGEN